MYNNPDFHIHSIFSDGSDTAPELLENVKRAGLDIFALTDHDTYAGCDKVRALLKDGDPTFVNGIEITCNDELGKYHILGYAFDTKKTSINDAISITQKARKEKAENRFNYLSCECGFTFTDAEKQEILSLSNPGKPHLVNLMLKKGYITDKQNGFDILKKYHGHERKLTPVEAIDAILHANGIPVLAHGILAEGSKNLSYDQIKERVDHLKNFGLMGLECYYSTYTKEQTEIMLRLSKEYNLFATAGSDYHGKNKTVKLGDTNSPNPEIMSRFFKTIEMFL